MKDDKVKKEIDEFKNFCGGSGDILYLHYWLQRKPNLTNNVVGGFLPKDKYDSTEIEISDENSSMSSSIGTCNPEKMWLW